MKARISPSFVSGKIYAPASKSVMQRACAAALIRKGSTIINRPGNSEDDLAAINIISRLGAEINQQKGTIVVTSNGVHPNSTEIHCGESGLSARMFTPIAALSDKEIMITGEGSLLKRPFEFFTTVLPLLHVNVDSNNGFLPLRLSDRLVPSSVTIDASLSSQFLTGLLMAFSAAHAQDVTITITGLNSKPYIDLTLQVMKEFGLHTPINNNYQSFYFPTMVDEVPSADPLEFTVEGDWSGGAFLLVAAAISGSLSINGLSLNSYQGDKVIMDVLKLCGADISIDGSVINIKSSSLKNFRFDATDTPDLFPPLVALAANCMGVSVIEGTKRLVHKESNRAKVLQEEFRKLGVTIKLDRNAMYIEGTTTIKSTTVNSNHDHRITMACAIAALKAEGDILIEGAEAVNKSYPAFWQDLQKIGVAVSLNDN